MYETEVDPELTRQENENLRLHSKNVELEQELAALKKVRADELSAKKDVDTGVAFVSDTSFGGE